MRIQKRLSAVLLTLLLSCALVLTTTLAYAAQPAPLWSRSGSCGINVRMLYDGKPLAGGSLTLYQVGYVNGQSMEFTLTSDFAGSNEKLGGFATDYKSSLARNLWMYAKNHNIQGTTKEIGATGEVKFEGLDFGLYLVVQKDNEHASGYDPIDPFLVSLPMYTEEEGYDYYIDAEPKIDKPNPPSPGGGDEEKPDEPSSEVSSEPESSQPESSEPESSQPESSQPESSQPGESSEPTSSEPGSTPGGTTPGGNTPGGNTPGGNTPGGGTTPGGGSSTPTLPQTGQLNWPIPVLVVAGLSLILVGWGVNYNSKSRKSHEA